MRNRNGSNRIECAIDAVLNPLGPRAAGLTQAQELVPDLAAARERLYQHTLKLEDARAQAAYGQHSFIGKMLEIHQELPGRAHIVLVREPVGY